MLQKASGLTSGGIHKCIHGHTTRGKAYSGLLEKCPAIAYCDRTVVTDEETGGVSMRRRTNAYTFDRDLYAIWCAGGGVWLDDDDDNSATAATISHDFHQVDGIVAGFENGFNEPNLQMSLLIIIIMYVQIIPVTNLQDHSSPKREVYVHLHMTVIWEMLQRNTQILFNHPRSARPPRRRPRFLCNMCRENR